jgi:D-threonate/D-erythronate kinase
MQRIAIVADDFTSAAGCRARVTFGPPQRAPLPAGVTAVDADSRSMPAAQAARRTAVVTTALASADVLFKTVDSTLRGHIVAEIDAALAVSGRRTAVIAPAFPAQGRTTVKGMQHLTGQPVDRTWFAQDPGHPVRCADLFRLLPGAVPMFPRPAQAVGRAGAGGAEGVAGGGQEVAGGGRGVKLAGNGGVGAGAARYVVADATSDADLDRLVAAVPMEQVLWVGSPGLAAALARRLGPCGHVPERGKDVPAQGKDVPAHGKDVPGQGKNVPGKGVSTRRVLFVIGSLHPASREQLAWICSAGGAAAIPVLDDGAAGQAERRLGRQQTVVLHGPTDTVAGRVVLDTLAQVTARLAEAGAFDALVITGGETARAVLLGCGVCGLDLAGELEPGIPLGFADDSRRLPVVVKAGGFGDRRLLTRLRDLMATT